MSFTSKDIVMEINIPLYCVSESCSNILYMCQFPDCYRFICDNCIEKMDAYVCSKKNNKKKIICVDCLPNVAVNIKSGEIRIRNKNQTKYETDKINCVNTNTNWISKNGFNPMSSKTTLFKVAAVAVAAAAAVAATVI